MDAGVATFTHPTFLRPTYTVQLMDLGRVSLVLREYYIHHPWFRQNRA